MSFGDCQVIGITAISIFSVGRLTPSCRKLKRQAASIYSLGACTFSPVDFGRNSVLQSLPVFDCPGQNSAWGQDELSSWSPKFLYSNWRQEGTCSAGKLFACLFCAAWKDQDPWVLTSLKDRGQESMKAQRKEDYCWVAAPAQKGWGVWTYRAPQGQTNSGVNSLLRATMDRSLQVELTQDYLRAQQRDSHKSRQQEDQ